MSLARDERVADVIEIIGRDKAHVDKIKQAILQLDSEQRRHQLLGPPEGLYRPLNKADKTTAKSLGLALGKLEKRLGGTDEKRLAATEVAKLIERATYGEHDEFFEWKAQLEHWRKRFGAFSGLAKTESELFEKPNTWPLVKGWKDEKFVRKNKAVAAAANILNIHGLPLTVTKKSDTRKGSVFCRLAAVLYGDKRADLSSRCRSYNEGKARNRVLK